MHGGILSYLQDAIIHKSRPVICLIYSKIWLSLPNQEAYMMSCLLWTYIFLPAFLDLAPLDILTKVAVLGTNALRAWWTLTQRHGSPLGWQNTIMLDIYKRYKSLYIGHVWRPSSLIKSKWFLCICVDKAKKKARKVCCSVTILPITVKVQLPIASCNKSCCPRDNSVWA